MDDQYRHRLGVLNVHFALRQRLRRDERLPDEFSEPLIFHLDNIQGHVEPGIESGAAGKAAAGYIEAAVELCAAGSIDAIATAPINKRALYLGGYTFPGYTAVYTVVLNLLVAIVLTPVFNAMSSQRAPVDETVAADYHDAVN